MRKRPRLLTIFLTIFIDLLGIGVIIPVIPALFFEADSVLFSPEVSQDMRSVLYGLLIASYPLMQFFGAPLLGSLSDRFGRKPVLLVSLVGTMIGYFLFAWAVLQQDIWMLFISRMLPGFTGGNISIILSSIADVSDDKSTAGNFGLIGVAYGMGFILGPTIGGLLSDPSLVSWFDASVPFWFTGILSFLNILFVYFFFGETLKERTPARIRMFAGIRNIGLSFAAPNLRVIFSVVLLQSLGFTFFTQFFSVFLIQKFQYSELDIGLLYGYIGICLALTQGLLVRKVSNHFASERVIGWSLFFLGIGFFIVLLPPAAWWLFVFGPVVAVAQGLTAPNLTAVVSFQVDKDRQGEILGINQSMHSVGQIIPPVIAGYLNTISLNLPIFSAAVITLLACLVYVGIFRRKDYTRKK